MEDTEANRQKIIRQLQPRQFSDLSGSAKLGVFFLGLFSIIATGFMTGWVFSNLLALYFALSVPVLSAFIGVLMSRVVVDGARINAKVHKDWREYKSEEVDYSTPYRNRMHPANAILHKTLLGLMAPIMLWLVARAAYLIFA